MLHRWSQREFIVIEFIGSIVMDYKAMEFILEPEAPESASL